MITNSHSEGVTAKDAKYAKGEMQTSPVSVFRMVRGSRSSGFTMIEIAIALGVIGFALVAIVGALPYGLNSQKQNREDTIINQDSTYFLESIRNNAQGLDELTNYVQKIWITKIRPNEPIKTYYYMLHASDDPSYSSQGFEWGSNIVGLLSYPKYVYHKGGINSGWDETNYVTAEVRALSGSALEQDGHNQVTAFNYLLTSELVPFGYTNHPDVYGYNMRLTFQWPLMVKGNPGDAGVVLKKGSREATVRSVVGGTLNISPDAHFYHFSKQIYQHQP